MMRRAGTPEEKFVVVAYLANKVGSTPQALVGQMPFEAATIHVRNRPMGAVLYSNYRGHSIELTGAGEVGWLTRGNLREIFAYPFLQLQCWTVLTMVNRRNASSRDLQRRLGFSELCVIETGMGKTEDVILYGLTKDKCRWIEPQKPVAPRANAMNGVAHHELV